MNRDDDAISIGTGRAFPSTWPMRRLVRILLTTDQRVEVVARLIFGGPLTEPIRWRSSRPDVAIVTPHSSGGYIEAVAPGQSIVTAKSGAAQYRWRVIVEVSKEEQL